MNINEGIVCFFDGACEPRNPGGNMGLGAIIYIDKKEFSSYSEYIPANKNNSNNVAEYSSFKWLLETLLKEGMNEKIIHIYGDSKLVIMQMKGYWRIKFGFYVNTAKECKELLKSFKNVSLKWIPREENVYADQLSKGEMINNNCEFRIQKNPA
jgi:ribonuclease HI